MTSDSNVKTFRNENEISVSQERDESKLTVYIGGYLNALTVSALQESLNADALKDVTHLIIDLENTEYMSSYGLRVFLTAQKMMDEKGGYMVVRKVNPFIMDLFVMTGFVKILNIQD